MKRNEGERMITKETKKASAAVFEYMNNPQGYMVFVSNGKNWIMRKDMTVDEARREAHFLVNDMEKTLTDKIYFDGGCRSLKVEDVKLFVKGLKKEMDLSFENAQIIDKLAGEELV